MRKIFLVKKLPIRLGQLLKLVDAVQDGLEAKRMILTGEIRVNGETATQRGKKIFPNDIVQINNDIQYIIHSTDS